MTGTTVYVDIIFLINFVMDLFILWATGKLAGLPTAGRRITAGAVLGALYAVGCSFPALASWYDLPIKLIFSALIVIIAFWPGDWRSFFRLWCYFFLVSFAMAGAAVGITGLAASGTNPDFRYWSLGGGIACAVGIGLYGDRLMRQRVIPAVLRCPVCIVFGEQRLEAQGFIDTGHSLLDPLTQKPVVIAELDLLRDCLPIDGTVCSPDDGAEYDMFAALAESAWANRIRLIPFTSIGRKHGLLVGVRCDEVQVKKGDQWLAFPGMVVGLYEGRLSPDGKFQMLLPASIFMK